MACSVVSQRHRPHFARIPMIAGCSLALASVLLLVGCGGGSDLPELGEVTGVVTLDGQPVSGAQVQFIPQSGRPSSGETDASGKYELHYTADVAGAVLGSHTVKINTAVDGRDDPSTEKIPARYNSKSELTEEVKSGVNEINFDLKSK